MYALLSFVVAASAVLTTPPLYFYNSSLLAHSLALISSQDPTVLPAYSLLLTTADKALNAKVWSVVDRYNASLIPFPMSNRSYTSVGFYYWPCTMTPPGRAPKNPSNCSKTTGLPWVYWDGEISPYVSSFDLDIWENTADSIQTLALAYYFTGGNETYAAKGIEVVRAWFTSQTTGMLPNLDHAQFEPGINTGTGSGCIDLDENIATGLLDCLSLLRVSPSWTPQDEGSLLAWVQAYTEWLLQSPNGRSENRTVNNHKAYFDAQLLQLALFAGNATLATLRAPAARAILDAQIAPNGTLVYEVARTRSNHYVAFCLQAYLGLSSGAAQAGVDLWGYTTSQGSSMLAAIEAVMPYSNGSQPWPFENLDGPAFNWASFFPVYRAAAWAVPQDAAALMAASESTLNATKADSLLRLLWPGPF
jgi:hypothetical protein